MKTIMRTIIFDLDGTLVDLARGLCFADVKQLKNLRKKYRFALVTGASRRETLRVLQRFGLNGLFRAEFIITKDEVSAPKSTGRPFRKIKKILDGPAIFIGDSRSDALGCARANLPCILVPINQLIGNQRVNFKRTMNQACRILDFMHSKC